MQTSVNEVEQMMVGVKQNHPEGLGYSQAIANATAAIVQVCVLAHFCLPLGVQDVAQQLRGRLFTEPSDDSLTDIGSLSSHEIGSLLAHSCLVAVTCCRSLMGFSRYLIDLLSPDDQSLSQQGFIGSLTMPSRLGVRQTRVPRAHH